MEDAHEHNQEEHRVSYAVTLNDHQHDERDNDDDDARAVMHEPPAPAVSRPPGDEHDGEAEEVRPDSHDGRARTRVAEPGDDGGQAKHDTVHRYIVSEVHQTPDVCSPVSEGGFDLLRREIFASLERTVGLVGEGDDRAFAGGEPGRGVGGG